ncbi:hemerythrin domain-containing protein [Ensifer sp. Root142]|uniref:hemerythrin domain-containing protein n=1 Tax=Ensifer sp. Root142 TaxID=1736461 RepID=UPI000A450BDD|nr:hemerythrin domain-containing protein [Ensifer sp. Root142]
MNATSRPLGAADIMRLETLHRELLTICLRLEEVAADIEMSASEPVRELAQSIPAILKEVHDLEEHTLFPDFDRNAGSLFAAKAIERLRLIIAATGWRQRNSHSSFARWPMAGLISGQTPLPVYCTASRKRSAGIFTPRAL